MDEIDQLYEPVSVLPFVGDAPQDDDYELVEPAQKAFGETSNLEDSLLQLSIDTLPEDPPEELEVLGDMTWWKMKEIQLQQKMSQATNEGDMRRNKIDLLFHRDQMKDKQPIYDRNKSYFEQSGKELDDYVQRELARKYGGPMQASREQSFVYRTVETFFDTAVNRFLAPIVRPFNANEAGRMVQQAEDNAHYREVARHTAGGRFRPRSPWFDRILSQGLAEAGVMATTAALAGGSARALGAGRAAEATTVGRTMIGQAMASQYVQSEYEGRRAGLKGKKLLAYAGAQATIEGAFASLFMRLHLPGAEQPLRITGGFRGLMKNIAAEVTEEELTAFAQAYADVISKVDPKALDADRATQLFVDTAAVTGIAVGAMQGPGVLFQDVSEAQQKAQDWTKKWKDQQAQKDSQATEEPETEQTTYGFRARGKETGETIKDDITAESEEQARQTLETMGWEVESIKAKKKVRPKTKKTASEELSPEGDVPSRREFKEKTGEDRTSTKYREEFTEEVKRLENEEAETAEGAPPYSPRVVRALGDQENALPEQEAQAEPQAAETKEAPGEAAKGEEVGGIPKPRFAESLAQEEEVEEGQSRGGVFVDQRAVQTWIKINAYAKGSVDKTIAFAKDKIAGYFHIGKFNILIEYLNPKTREVVKTKEVVSVIGTGADRVVRAREVGSKEPAEGTVVDFSGLFHGEMQVRGEGIRPGEVPMDVEGGKEVGAKSSVEPAQKPSRQVRNTISERMRGIRPRKQTPERRKANARLRQIAANKMTGEELNKSIRDIVNTSYNPDVDAFLRIADGIYDDYQKNAEQLRQQAEEAGETVDIPRFTRNDPDILRAALSELGSYKEQLKKDNPVFADVPLTEIPSDYLTSKEATRRNLNLDEDDDAEFADIEGGPSFYRGPEATKARVKPEEPHVKEQDIPRGVNRGGVEHKVVEEAITFDHVRPIEAPELARLVKLLDAELIAKDLPPSVRGKYLDRTRRILLSKELGKDPVFLSYVLGHEIGHLFDYVREGRGKDDPLVKRIAVLVDSVTRSIAESKHGPSPVVSEEDKARMRDELKERLSRTETIEEIVEEEIRTEFNVGPEDIMAVWNSLDTSRVPKELMDYIKRLSPDEKFRIVKDAIKGEVSQSVRDALPHIVETIRRTEQREVRVPPSDSALKEELDKAILEELARRHVVHEAVIQDELWEVSQWWRPYEIIGDPKSKDAKAYVRARKQRKEIFADAISVLLNAPAELEQRAPTFFRAWIGWMENHPDVLKAYGELQELLSGDSDAVSEMRSKSVHEMFGRGYEAERARQEAIRRAKMKPFETFIYEGSSAARDVMRRIWDGIGHAFHSKGAGILNRGLRDTERRALPKWAQFITGLETLPFVRQQRLRARAARTADRVFHLSQAPKAVHERVVAKVVKSLVNRGGTTAQLGELLHALGIIVHRSDAEGYELLNPNLWSRRDAIRQSQFLKRKWGDETFQAVSDAADTLHEIAWEVVEDAYASNLITDAAYKRAKENKHHYAAFVPIYYLSKGVDASFRPATGTVLEVADQFLMTVAKIKAIKYAATQNRLKAEILDWLKQLPGDVVYPLTKNQTVRSKRDRKTIVYEEHGKKKRYGVPADFEWLFSDPYKNLGDVGQVLQQGRRAIYTMLYPLYVVYSIGFAVSNFVARDPMRNFLQMPGIIGKFRKEKMRELIESGLSPKVAKEQARARIPPVRPGEFIFRYAKKLPQTLLGTSGLAPEDIRKSIQFLPQKIRDPIMSWVEGNWDDLNWMREVGLVSDNITDMERYVDDPIAGEFALRRRLMLEGLVSKDEWKKNLDGAARFAAEAVDFAHQIGETPPGRIAKTLIGVMPYMSDTTELWSKLAMMDAMLNRDIPLRDAVWAGHNNAGTPATKRKGLLSPLTDTARVFWTVIAHGMISQYRMLKDPDTRYNYGARLFVASVATTGAWWLAKQGLMGDWLKELAHLFDDEDEDRDLLFPLGIERDPEDNLLKGVAFRIRKDEGAQLVSRMTRIVLDAIEEEKPGELGKILPLIYKDIFGPMSAPFNITARWMDYASGNQPVDRYTGYPIVDRASWEASFAKGGEKAARRDMAAYTLRQWGIASDLLMWGFGKTLGEPFEASPNTELEQSVRGNPILRRLLLVSRRGATNEQFERAQLREAASAYRTVFKKDDTHIRRALTKYGLLRKVPEKQDSLSAQELHEWKILQRWYKNYNRFMSIAIRERDSGNQEEAERIRDVFSEETRYILRWANADTEEDRDVQRQAYWDYIERRPTVP